MAAHAMSANALVAKLGGVAVNKAATGARAIPVSVTAPSRGERNLT